MKGQFMLMSSIIIGIILISTSSTISGIQSNEVNSATIAYDVNTIKNEAEDIDFKVEKNRENFRKMIKETRYQSEITYWQSRNCFNITLTDSKSQATLNCVSGN